MQKVRWSLFISIIRQRTKQKKICMLSDNIQYIECAAVTDRYIAIGYYNQYDKKIMKICRFRQPEFMYMIWKIKRQNNIWKRIVQCPNFVNRYYKKGEVYYSLLGYDVSEKQALKHSEDWDYLDKHIVESIYRSDFREIKIPKYRILIIRWPCNCGRINIFTMIRVNYTHMICRRT